MLTQTQRCRAQHNSKHFPEDFSSHPNLSWCVITSRPLCLMETNCSWSLQQGLEQSSAKVLILICLMPNQHTLMPLRKQVYCFPKDSDLAQLPRSSKTAWRSLLSKALTGERSITQRRCSHRSWLPKYHSTNEQRCLQPGSEKHARGAAMALLPLFIKQCLFGILSSMLLFASLAPSQAQMIAHHNPSN